MRQGELLSNESRFFSFMNSRIASCKFLLTKRRQVLVSLLDTIPCAQPCLVRAPRFYSTVSGKGGEHGRGRERKKERVGNNNKGGGSSGRVKTLKCPRGLALHNGSNARGSKQVDPL